MIEHEGKTKIRVNKTCSCGAEESTSTCYTVKFNREDYNRSIMWYNPDCCQTTKVLFLTQFSKQISIEEV